LKRKPSKSNNSNGAKDNLVISPISVNGSKADEADVGTAISSANV
jgi:hypothetical protein